MELKKNTEDKKKKVEFIATGETSTQDNTENNEQQAPKKKSKRKKKKAVFDTRSGQSSAISETEDTDINSGAEASSSGKAKDKKKTKSKKAKEKEILEKCREQEAPVKYGVSTEDKTVEETKKVLWTQLVSRIKAPKIKEIITLKGGDLLITPADESTKEAIVSIAKEGF